MDDISEFEIKLIEKLAPDIADPELKAYFNDLLWLKTRAHTAARNAIHLFLASAHHLECSAHWSECVARLQRAAVLAVSIGARKSELRVVSLRISETIDRISATDNGFASHSLMLVLLGVKEGDPHKWAPLCEVLAHRAEAAGKWQVARAYWGLKADWHGCAKEAAKQKEARLLSAETYVSESDCVLAMPRPSRFWAANLLAQAVEALRNAGATSTYVDEIHRRLLAIQSSAMEEMQTIPTNQIDISEHIRISQQVVRGRSVREAIAVLCRFMDPVKESETKARVEASTKKFLFIHLIGREFVNAEGKSIARAPGALSGGPEPLEEAIRADMEHTVQLEYSLRFHMFLAPMLEVIYSEHPVRLSDLDFINSFLLATEYEPV